MFNYGNGFYYKRLQWGYVQLICSLYEYSIRDYYRANIAFIPMQACNITNEGPNLCASHYNKPLPLEWKCASNGKV